VTERTRVLVVGATRDDLPAGIEAASRSAELSFAAGPADVARRIADAEVIFAWRPDAELLTASFDRATRLRWVQAASAGVDSLLFDGLVASDVVVTNARGIFEEAMAETVLGFMIAFAKGFPRAFANQREHLWSSAYSERLGGRRVLVVGAGPIGTAIGRLARGLGMRVVGVGRSARRGDEVFEQIHATGDLLGVLGDADFVVDALPLTTLTRHLFGEAAFRAMSSTARFVNVGRGATVDEGALVRALEAGEIAGAALDVFEQEPLTDRSPLWDMEQVIVFPHVSGDVFGWEEDVVGLFVENLDRFCAGEPLRNVVDKRAGHPTS
jgi:phosphoglycerate dehydrogenase-like enzyme